MTEKEYWDDFVKKSGLEDEAKYAGDFGFEARGFAGTERLASVLAGKKTAAFFSYASFAVDNEELPLSDEYYIVLGADREPLCIIKTTSVQVLPYDQVTWEMAQKEGEDSSLEEWRQKTRENLEEEGDLVGFDFTPDLKLIYMEFKVVHR
ncbi:MAG: ASCH domain-containing protein [Treponema sp.]|nr:ASCH domain-containing protein [Treponema sp.]